MPENAEVEVMPDILPGGVMLDSLRDGQVLEDIGDALRDLNLLVLLHNAKGVLTVKLTVTPQGQGMVHITDEIDTKAPRAALPSTLRYVDKAGNLKQNNPDRPDLMQAVRSLDPDTGEIRRP